MHPGYLLKELSKMVQCIKHVQVVLNLPFAVCDIIERDKLQQLLKNMGV